MEVEVGDEIVVVSSHHADCLGLPEDAHHVLHVTVEDDVDLTRLFDLTQNTSENIFIYNLLFIHLYI